MRQIIPSAVAILVVLAAFVLPPVSAAAQTVEKRVERVEKQLRAVQRKVFGSPDAAPADGGDPAADSRMADMEVRLQGIENQIRTLNGQVEEMRFQLEETNRRLEKFQADAEFRFDALEKGGAATGGSSSVAPSTPAPAGTASTSAPGPAPSSPRPSGALPAGTPMEQYDYAYKLLAQGDYGAAETAFKSFLDKHPGDELAGNAQYWLAQSYFVRGQNEQAAKEFLTGYQNYPNSPKAAAYLLKIGITLTRIGQTNDACDVFTELASRHPDSPEARQRMPEARANAGCP